MGQKTIVCCTEDVLCRSYRTEKAVDRSTVIRKDIEERAGPTKIGRTAEDQENWQGITDDAKTL